MEYAQNYSLSNCILLKLYSEDEQLTFTGHRVFYRHILLSFKVIAVQGGPLHTEKCTINNAQHTLVLEIVLITSGHKLLLRL